jgi:hypothetical protein
MDTPYRRPRGCWNDFRLAGLFLERIELMKVCDGIEKVNGGYIVTVRFPYGSYHDDGKVICATFEDVIKLLRKSANEPEVTD